MNQKSLKRKWVSQDFLSCWKYKQGKLNKLTAGGDGCIFEEIPHTNAWWVSYLFQQVLNVISADVFKRKCSIEK